MEKTRRRKEGQSPLMTYVVSLGLRVGQDHPHTPIPSIHSCVSVPPTPRPQIAGTAFVSLLVVYLLRFLTKLHHSDQSLKPNAPMPAAPGSQPQSAVLYQAAESRRLDSERNQIQHDPALGLRTAG